MVEGLKFKGYRRALYIQLLVTCLTLSRSAAKDELLVEDHVCYILFKHCLT